MRPTTLSMLVCAMACAGCLPPSLLAGRDRCHLAAKPATVVGWCRPPGGKPEDVEECRVQVLPGDPVCPAEATSEKRPADAPVTQPAPR